MIIFTIDVPGDGPTRASLAYAMFLSPYLMTHGDWLPGYNYLHSLFYLILENPALTPRIVNVILGTLTVPLFYLLIAKVFDRSVAMISALLLMCFPLHIGLSASSLTEPTFLFEFITGSLFLILAANGEKYQLAYLLLALFLLSLAIMTRYEGWVLVPIFVIYYYARTKSIPRSFLVAMVLTIYPVTWTISNYHHFGDPFFGFTAAKGSFHGTKPVSSLEAVAIIDRKFSYHLGWILPVAMVVGIALQLRDLLRKQFTLEQIFYLSATIMYALGIFRFAITRGNDLWDRYLLFSFVLMLPFAVVAVSYFVVLRSRAGVAAIALLFTVSVAYNPKLYGTLDHRYSDLCVTLWRPNEIIDISTWLKSSPYRNYVVLLTENDGQSWYLPTYFPPATLRYGVIATYTTDTRIVDDYLTMGKRLGNHYLLITSDQDRSTKERVERLIGGEIGDNRLIHTQDHIRTYDISTLLDLRVIRAARERS